MAAPAGRTRPRGSRRSGSAHPAPPAGRSLAGPPRDAPSGPAGCTPCAVFGVPPGSGMANHQRRRIAPVAQPQLRLQRRPRRSRLTRATAAASADCRARGPGGSVQVGRGRLVGDDGQVPGRQLPTVPPDRQVAALVSGRGRPGSLPCPGRGTVRTAPSSVRSGCRVPPVTLTVRRDAGRHRHRCRCRA